MHNPQFFYTFAAESNTILNLQNRERMKTTSFLPFSSAILWTTIICTIIIVVSIIYLAQRATVTSDNITRIMYWASTGILTLALLSAIAIYPRKAIVNDNAIDIHMVMGKIHIPTEEILSIEHYSNGIDSHRIVGAGMFFGNLGIFDSSECGRHFSLVTNPKDVCIITRKTKQPVVISVQDYSIFNTLCEVKEKN